MTAMRNESSLIFLQSSYPYFIIRHQKSQFKSAIESESIHRPQPNSYDFTISAQPKHYHFSPNFKNTLRISHLLNRSLVQESSGL